MPEWIIGMIGLVLGALSISLTSAIQSHLSNRAMRAIRPVRAP